MARALGGRRRSGSRGARAAVAVAVAVAAVVVAVCVGGVVNGGEWW